MALYVNGQKVKINLNGVAYCLKIFQNKGAMLLSADNYKLVDLKEAKNNE